MREFSNFGSQNLELSIGKFEFNGRFAVISLQNNIFCSSSKKQFKFRF